MTRTFDPAVEDTLFFRGSSAAKLQIVFKRLLRTVDEFQRSSRCAPEERKHFAFGSGAKIMPKRMA